MKPWWEQVRWMGDKALEWVADVPLDRHKPVYAECQGPEDPHCGRCRFSVHGCNGGRHSRAEFLKMLESGKATIKWA